VLRMAFYQQNAHLGDKSNTEDHRIRGYSPLVAPNLLQSMLPQPKQSKTTVLDGRREVEAVLAGEDDRLIVIVGPCSIHDPKSAVEYASRLVELRKELHKDLCIVMRCYLEKPRTTVGWKGLINDPHLDETFDINAGLNISRQVFIDITSLGLPIASEMLDTISPQYTSDLLSIGAVGARTTESQLHRELASGLSFAIGFKNGTDGSAGIAIDAIRASSKSHSFLSVTKPGVVAIVGTNGNPDCFIILRGGNSGTNYDAESISGIKASLKKAGVKQNIMVDCSHGNSQKNHKNQPLVAQAVGDQLMKGEECIIGMMVESHLKEGKQELKPGAQLEYGKSITDACIGWEDTCTCLRQLAEAVAKRRNVTSMVRGEQLNGH